MSYVLDDFVADVEHVVKKGCVSIEMQWSLGTKLQRLV